MEFLQVLVGVITCNDMIQALKVSLEVPVGPVTKLRAKMFKEAFNGLLQDTWAKVDFKRILITRSKPLLILFMFKRGLLVEPRPLHKD
jgi:hypothetical protein